MIKNIQIFPNRLVLSKRQNCLRSKESNNLIELSKLKFANPDEESDYLDFMANLGEEEFEENDIEDETTVKKEVPNKEGVQKTIDNRLKNETRFPESSQPEEKAVQKKLTAVPILKFTNPEEEKDFWNLVENLENYIEDFQKDEEQEKQKQQPVEVVEKQTSERLKWTKDNFKLVLYCDISELKRLQFTDIKHFSSRVFVTKRADKEIPVIYAAFCGTLTGYKRYDNQILLEVTDRDENVVCRADPLPSEKIAKNRQQYAMALEDYQNKLKAFEQFSSSYHSEKRDEAHLNMLACRRFCEFDDKMYEIFCIDKDKRLNRQVMVEGKVYWWNGRVQVLVNQCHYVSDEEENMFRAAVRAFY